jgi:hypothetical protein
MLRMKGFTRHLIFSRLIRNGVEIIRVIHTLAISRLCSSCEAFRADAFRRPLIG